MSIFVAGDEPVVHISMHVRVPTYLCFYLSFLDTEKWMGGMTLTQSKHLINIITMSMAATKAAAEVDINSLGRRQKIDSGVLNCLSHQPRDPQYYHEESSYRFHNPPFNDLPSGHDKQLAVVRSHDIPGNMKPVTDDKLRGLPPAAPLPQLPQSNYCDWKFDEDTRVLLADFTKNENNGEVVISPEDEIFLMEMMERDDITVVSEGLAPVEDISLLDLKYVKEQIGNDYHYKIKEFERNTPKTDGSDLTGEVNGTYSENTQWHSMKFETYFNYLKHCSTNESISNDFIFTNGEGKKVTIDTSKTVLVSLIKFMYLSLLLANNNLPFQISTYWI